MDKVTMAAPQARTWVVERGGEGVESVVFTASNIAI
jgi:hypothetical protein